MYVFVKLIKTSCCTAVELRHQNTNQTKTKTISTDRHNQAKQSEKDNIERLSKRQIMDKIKEYEKSLSVYATRYEKVRQNLQYERERVNELNDEIRRLKLENEHLQNVLLRETKEEEDQDLIEMFIDDFRDKSRKSMNLEHSLMVTEWELMDKTEDLKALSEKIKEKDERHNTELEQIKIQIRALEARDQRNKEWITKTESSMIEIKESGMELEEKIREKDKIIEDLEDELRDREKTIEDLRDQLNKANRSRKVPASTRTTHDVDEPPSVLSNVRWGAQVIAKNIIYLQNHLF